jgi:hypothetical protein
VKLAVVANDELTALLAQLLVPIKFPVNEPEKLPVLICRELDTVPTGSIVGAYELLIAKLEVVALLELIVNEALIALLAQLLVPIKFPVNEPEKLPVLICTDDDTSPFGLSEIVLHELAAPDT